MKDAIRGVLALEDGTVFRGRAFGAAKTVVGEAVFNTSMTGYQEILTDPSYYQQVVAMTAPQIGNYGINLEDNESDGPKVAAFVVRELSPVTSNWRSRQSLDTYLEQNDIPGLDGIDVRTLTKKLRTAGAMKACVSTEDISDEEAVERARSWNGLVGVDSVKEVTCKAPYRFEADDVQSFTVEGTELNQPIPERERFHIAAIDFGAKRSIFKRLMQHGFDITVFPADVTPEQIEACNPDALFLTNGPGDPAALTYAHKTVAALLPKYPTFGICMGHQIITHALGAKTYKLKFGHRGGNQPVKNLETGVVRITAQNHGFAACEESLKRCGAIITEVSLNDGAVEGLRHEKYPVFSVQYHPEAAPGPNDAIAFFEDFYQKLAQLKAVTA